MTAPDSQLSWPTDLSATPGSPAPASVTYTRLRILPAGVHRRSAFGRFRPTASTAGTSKLCWSPSPLPARRTTTQRHGAAGKARSGEPPHQLDQTGQVAAGRQGGWSYPMALRGRTLLTSCARSKAASSSATAAVRRPPSTRHPRYGVSTKCRSRVAGMVCSGAADPVPEGGVDLFVDLACQRLRNGPVDVSVGSIRADLEYEPAPRAGEQVDAAEAVV